VLPIIQNKKFCTYSLQGQLSDKLSNLPISPTYSDCELYASPHTEKFCAPDGSFRWSTSWRRECDTTFDAERSFHRAWRTGANKPCPPRQNTAL
jgi:hypothetical protein